MMVKGQARQTAGHQYGSNETTSDNKNCTYYLKKLDYEILKPMLIYKYQHEEMHRQDDYIDMMQSDANLIGSIYGKLDESHFNN